MTAPVFILFFIASTLGCVTKDDPPQWSSVYTVKGVLSIPYAEVNEPFSAWYDSDNGKSRIDYYGTTVKTYQLTSSAYPEYGTFVKIVPVTTEEVLNKKMYLQVNGTQDQPIGVQTVLPNMTDFEYIGQETVQGFDTAKWRLVETIEEKVNNYTMWVKCKPIRGDRLPIPVRYDMKGYNTLLDFHYDHYYINYSDYDVNDIDPSVFDLHIDTQYTSSSGPDTHTTRATYATFNPMKEFVYPVHNGHVNAEFERFKTKHNKVYASDVEHEKRVNIFRQNLRYIHSNNRANRGFRLDVNHLADQTDDELAALRGRRYSGPDPAGLPFPHSKADIKKMSVKLPTEFDWRLFGAVTPVEDQAVCGSCWSFTAAGAMEGALVISGGPLVRLSKQALIDCSWGYGNVGCDGGQDSHAYKWIMKHGLPTEEDYGGYLGQDGYCHIDNVTHVTSIKGWVNVTTNNENALRLAIFKHGPISVAFDGSHRSFSFYSDGVYFEPECMNKVGELDHAVLAIGYGVLNDQKYWLVKNSWSKYWGNEGYALVSSRDNNCGIETAPTYVLI